MTVPPGIGNIVAMMVIGDRLYFLCGKGISSALAADAVDPKRVNPKLPAFVQQIVLRHGMDEGFMAWTVAAANALFDQTYLRAGVDVQKGKELGLKVARELAAVTDIFVALHAREVQTRKDCEEGRVQVHYLPETEGLRGQVEQGIHHLNNAGQAIVTLAELFYPRRKASAKKERWKSKWRESLISSVRETFDADDPFLAAMEGVFDRIVRVENFRNALVHPSGKQEVVVFDYELQPEGDLIAPSVEIRHAETPLPRTNVIQFMEEARNELVTVFRDFISVFCDRNRAEFPGLGFQVEVVKPPVWGSPLGWRAYQLEDWKIAEP